MASLMGFFFLAIFFSFLCSIWEAVILSITPTFIKTKENEDVKFGKLLAGLKKDIDRPLAAVLTLNTFAHTIGAVGVGAQAGKLFGATTIYFLGLSVTIEALIAAIMTLAILFLSEIIPKTLGANNWRRLAYFTVQSLRVLIVILFPFVWLSNRLARILKKDKLKSVFSKQDFAALADVVSASGVIDSKDYTIIKNVLGYDELRTKDVMTPRTVMVTADDSLSLKEYYEKYASNRFSRIPLYHKEPDSITGLLLKDDLLEALVEGKAEMRLSEIGIPPIIVPESMPLRELFKTLNDKQEHLAVVVNEYGTVQGIASLEDIIETLLGLEIMDEKDSIADLQLYARKKWEERAKKMGLLK